MITLRNEIPAQGRRFEKNMSEEIKWAVLGTGVIANDGVVTFKCSR